MKKLLFIIFQVLISSFVFSTHLAGGWFEYECVREETVIMQDGSVEEFYVYQVNLYTIDFESASQHEANYATRNIYVDYLAEDGNGVQNFVPDASKTFKFDLNDAHTHDGNSHNTHTGTHHFETKPIGCNSTTTNKYTFRHVKYLSEFEGEMKYELYLEKSRYENRTWRLRYEDQIRNYDILNLGGNKSFSVVSVIHQNIVGNKSPNGNIESLDVGLSLNMSNQLIVPFKDNDDLINDRIHYGITTPKNQSGDDINYNYKLIPDYDDATKLYPFPVIHDANLTEADVWHIDANGLLKITPDDPKSDGTLGIASGYYTIAYMVSEFDDNNHLISENVVDIQYFLIRSDAVPPAINQERGAVIDESTGGSYETPSDPNSSYQEITIKANEELNIDIKVEGVGADDGDGSDWLLSVTDNFDEYFSDYSYTTEVDPLDQNSRLIHYTINPIHSEIRRSIYLVINVEYDGKKCVGSSTSDKYIFYMHVIHPDPCGSSVDATLVMDHDQNASVTDFLGWNIEDATEKYNSPLDQLQISNNIYTSEKKTVRFYQTKDNVGDGDVPKGLRETWHIDGWLRSEGIWCFQNSGGKAFDLDIEIDARQFADYRTTRTSYDEYVLIVENCCSEEPDIYYLERDIIGADFKTLSVKGVRIKPGTRHVAIGKSYEYLCSENIYPHPSGQVLNEYWHLDNVFDAINTFDLLSSSDLTYTKYRAWHFQNHFIEGKSGYNTLYQSLIRQPTLSSYVNSIDLQHIGIGHLEKFSGYIYIPQSTNEDVLYNFLFDPDTHNEVVFRLSALDGAEVIHEDYSGVSNDQKEASALLKSGQFYRLEFIYKHEITTSQLNFKWKGPDHTSFQPIPEAYLSIDKEYYPTGTIAKFINSDEPIYKATSGTPGLEVGDGTVIKDIQLELSIGSDRLINGDFLRFSHDARFQDVDEFSSADGGFFAKGTVGDDVDFTKIKRSWCINFSTSQSEVLTTFKFKSDVLPVLDDYEDYVLLISEDGSFDRNTKVYMLDNDYRVAAPLSGGNYYVSLGRIKSTVSCENYTTETVSLGVKKITSATSNNLRFSIPNTLVNRPGDTEYFTFSSNGASTTSYAEIAAPSNIYKFDRQWCAQLFGADGESRAINLSVSKSSLDAGVDFVNNMYRRNTIQRVILISNEEDFSSYVRVIPMEEEEDNYIVHNVPISDNQFLAYGYINDTPESSYYKGVVGLGLTYQGYFKESLSSGIFTLSQPQDLDENEFLVVGTNGNSVDIESNTYQSGDLQSRAAAAWVIREYGDVGTVDVQFKLSSMADNLQDLPQDTRVVMLVSDEDNFSNYNLYVLHRVEGDGDLFYVATDVDISDNQYITYAKAQHIITEPRVLACNDRIGSSSECVLKPYPVENFDINSKSPCEKIEDGAYLITKLELDPALGHSIDDQWKLQYSITMEAKDSDGNTLPYLQEFSNMLVELDYKHVDQVLSYHFTSDQLEEIERIQINVEYTDGSKINYQDNVLVSSELQLETRTRVHETIAPVVQIEEMRYISDVGHVAHFEWDNNGCDAPYYHFELLKLSNQNEYTVGDGDPSDNTDDHGLLNATVDWSQALRIDVPKTSIDLTLTQGTGYYLWRVRPIGDFEKGGIGNADNWGTWSIAASQDEVIEHLLPTSSLAHNYEFFYEQFDTDKNFVYNRTFTENGKMSEAIQYGNGLGQSVQSQGHISSNHDGGFQSGEIVGSQIVYDYNGRPVIQSMAAPLDFNDEEGHSELGYREGLLLVDDGNQGLKELSASDFDNKLKTYQDASGETKLTYDYDVPLVGGDIYEYWSEENKDQRIPDAQGYAYSRVKHFEDGSGRVEETSGVGKDFKLGSQHTTRVSYATATEEELIRIFGEEAPRGDKVLKQITLDPNNIASVTYINLEGETLATALVNIDATSTNLQPIINNQTGEFTVYSHLNNETQQDDGFTLFASTKVDFKEDNKSLSIDFNVTPNIVNGACGSYCEVCSYTGRIEVLGYNELDEQVVEFEKEFIIDQSSSLVNTNVGSCEPSIYTMNPEVVQDLSSGTYVVNKYLSLNEQRALDFADEVADETETYLNNQTTVLTYMLEEISSATGQFTIDDFLNKLIDHINSSEYSPYDVRITQEYDNGTSSVVFNSSQDDVSLWTKNSFAENQTFEIVSECCSVKIPVLIPMENPCDPTKTDDEQAALIRDEVFALAQVNSIKDFSIVDVNGNYESRFFQDISNIDPDRDYDDLISADGSMLARSEPLRKIFKNMLYDGYECEALLQASKSSAIVFAGRFKPTSDFYQENINHSEIEENAQEELSKLGEEVGVGSVSTAPIPYSFLDNLFNIVGYNFRAVAEPYKEGVFDNPVHVFYPHAFVPYYPALNDGSPYNKYAFAEKANCVIMDDYELPAKDELSLDYPEIPDFSDPTVQLKYQNLCDLTNCMFSLDVHDYRAYAQKNGINYTASEYLLFFNALKVPNDLEPIANPDELIAKAKKSIEGKCKDACETHYCAIVTQLEELYNFEEADGSFSYRTQNDVLIDQNEIYCTAQSLVEDCQASCTVTAQTMDCNGIDKLAAMGTQEEMDYITNVMAGVPELILPMPDLMEGDRLYSEISREALAVFDLLSELILYHKTVIGNDIIRNQAYDITQFAAFLTYRDLLQGHYNQMAILSNGDIRLSHSTTGKFTNIDLFVSDIETLVGSLASVRALGALEYQIYESFTFDIISYDAALSHDVQLSIGLSSGTNFQLYPNIDVQIISSEWVGEEEVPSSYKLVDKDELDNIRFEKCDGSSFGLERTVKYAFKGDMSDKGSDLIEDEQGNIYTVGSTNSHNVNGAPLAGRCSLDAADASDLVVSKYSKSGNLLWRSVLGGEGFEDYHSYLSKSAWLEIHNSVLYVFSSTDFSDRLGGCNRTSTGSTWVKTISVATGNPTGIDLSLTEFDQELSNQRTLISEVEKYENGFLVLLGYEFGPSLDPVYRFKLINYDFNFNVVWSKTIDKAKDWPRGNELGIKFSMSCSMTYSSDDIYVFVNYNKQNLTSFRFSWSGDLLHQNATLDFDHERPHWYEVINDPLQNERSVVGSDGYIYFITNESRSEKSSIPVYDLVKGQFTTDYDGNVIKTDHSYGLTLCKIDPITLSMVEMIPFTADVIYNRIWDNCINEPGFHEYWDREVHYNPQLIEYNKDYLLIHSQDYENQQSVGCRKAPHQDVMILYNIKTKQFFKYRFDQISTPVLGENDWNDFYEYAYGNNLLRPTEHNGLLLLKTSPEFGENYSVDGKNFYVMEFKSSMDCNPHPVGIRWKPAPTFPSEQPKEAHEPMTFADIEARKAYPALQTMQASISDCIVSMRDELEEQYVNECMRNNTPDNSTVVSYEQGVSHYTLYYYDRAGNLIKTVPPQGVKLYDITALAEDNGAIEDNSKIVLKKRLTDTPEQGKEYHHDMVTRYTYNALGQMLKTHTPDGGLSQFLYNEDGALRFSVNEEQESNNRVSYVKYDALGRIIESGELANFSWFTLMANPDYYLGNGGSSYDKYGIGSYPFSYNAFTQKTITHYSELEDGAYYLGDPAQPQRYLRNRVSHTYIDQDGKLNTPGDQAHSYYSYDPHGNVEWIAQKVPGVGIQYIAYEYDLISGNVTKVKYNEGLPDQFYHRYEYDADNRLLWVETSTNGIVWERDQENEYYMHGALSKMIIGEDQVQGVDYAYTIQGWLKGINHHNLNADYDPLGDGGTSSNIAQNAFGMLLGYHDNDFKKTGSIYSVLENTDHIQTSKSLYNGNISSWSWGHLKDYGNPDTEQVTNGFEYEYDYLNRIKESNFRIFDNDSWSAESNALAYHTEYEYDANGNIESLIRHASNNTPIDQLSYTYGEENNQLLAIADASGLSADVDNDMGDASYGYDAIGNITDISEQTSTGIKTTEIEWNASGKISKVTKPEDNMEIEFLYDPSGNRVKKSVSKNGLVDNTMYVRDASGNVMATYFSKGASSNYTLQEQTIYGSDRLGLYRNNIERSNLPEVDLSDPESLTYREGIDKELTTYHVEVYEGEVGYLLEGNSHGGAYNLKGGTMVIEGEFRPITYSYPGGSTHMDFLFESGTLIIKDGGILSTDDQITVPVGSKIINYGTLNANGGLVIGEGSEVINYGSISTASASGYILLGEQGIVDLLDGDYSNLEIDLGQTDDNNTVNQYLSFKGADDPGYVISSKSYGPYAGPGKLTAECWFNTSYQGGASPYPWAENWSLINFDRSEVFNVYVTAGNYTSSVSLDSDLSGSEQGYIGFSTATGDIVDDMFGRTRVDDGKWHHVAVTYDMATGMKQIFVDGVLDYERSSRHQTGTQLGGNETRYGTFGADVDTEIYDRTQSATMDRYFKGNIDDIRIWHTVRSEAEIVENKDQLGTERSGLELWYNFDSDVDGTVKDNSSNNYDGEHYVNTGATYETKAKYDRDFKYSGRILGSKAYELKDHLGNVRVVISDRKFAKETMDNRYLNFEGESYKDYVISQKRYEPNAGPEQLTAECWFNTTYQGSNWSDNISLIDFDRSENFALYITAGNYPGGNTLDGNLPGSEQGKIGFSTSSGDIIDDMFGTTRLDDGQWHHVAVTYNMATGLKQIFVDGVLDYQRVARHASGQPLGGDDPRYGIIGANCEHATFDKDADHTYYYTGNLDDVRLWHTVRTPEQIAANMKKLSGDKDHLQFWYTFDNDKDGVVTDMSGNGLYAEHSTNTQTQYLTDTRASIAYLPEVLSYHNYYPFGWEMPGKNADGESKYRYGFNGAEKDGEFTGNTGDVYNLGLRMYDARIARMFKLDPRAVEYPWQSPYVYHRNSPIWIIDYLGGGAAESIVQEIMWVAEGAGASAAEGASSGGLIPALIMINAYLLQENIEDYTLLYHLYELKFAYEELALIQQEELSIIDGLNLKIFEDVNNVSWPLIEELRELQRMIPWEMTMEQVGRLSELRLLLDENANANTYLLMPDEEGGSAILFRNKRPIKIYKPYTFHRPSYRKGVVQKVWDKAVKKDGKVYDPNTGELIEWDKSKSRQGQWDMGHIKGQKYSEVHRKYLNGKISKKEFLDWYNNPDNYRPELPSNNRNHKYE